MFLDLVEMKQLTSYQTAKKQILWLQNNNIRYLVSSDGHPKVLRTYIENLLSEPQALKKNLAEPNFDAIECF